jgi:hypothetical protein
MGQAGLLDLAGPFCALIPNLSSVATPRRWRSCRGASSAATSRAEADDAERPRRGPIARRSTIVTSNLPFDEWTGVFASERLTGALLDRLTHHVHILEMNGDSYRLKQSKHRQRGDRPTDPPDNRPEG